MLLEHLPHNHAAHRTLLQKGEFLFCKFLEFSMMMFNEGCIGPSALKVKSWGAFVRVYLSAWVIFVMLSRGPSYCWRLTVVF